MKAEGGRRKAGDGRRRQLAVRCLLLTVFCLLPSAYCLAAGAWSRQTSGSFAWLHAVFFLNENRGWAVGGKGVVLATTDGGKQWRALPRPTEDSLQDVHFADELNGWLVCERSIYELKSDDEPRTYLLRTEDGGQTWRRVNVTAKGAEARLVRALFTDGGRGWVFGEAGALYTTRDGGANWERQNVPTRHLLLGGSFLNAAQGWLVGAGTTLLQTSDGGESWRPGTLLGPSTVAVNKRDTPPRVRFTAASFVSATRGWAVGAEGRAFSTRDGGRTWSPQVTNTTSDLLDVKFLNEYEGWACGAQGALIHTKDGGAHWAVEPSGTTHALERLFFAGWSRGWAVGFGGTIISYTPAAAAPQKPELKKP